MTETRDPNAPAPAVAPVSVAGEIDDVERGRWLRALSAITGWSLVRGTVRGVGRLVFSWKRPATITLDGERLRVVGHSEFLGRTLRTFDVRWPLAGIAEIRREERFPALPVAIGAFALALGAILGARSVIEGAGVSYFPLVAIGLGAIAGGIFVEFVTRALFPGTQGRTRLHVRGADGRGVVLTNLPVAELDRLLDAIDRRYGAGRV